MQANLAKLTAFNNRYYRSSTGADASAWILSTVKAVRGNASSELHLKTDSPYLPRSQVHVLTSQWPTSLIAGANLQSSPRSQARLHPLSLSSDRTWTPSISTAPPAAVHPAQTMTVQAPSISSKLSASWLPQDSLHLLLSSSTGTLPRRLAFWDRRLLPRAIKAQGSR